MQSDYFGEKYVIDSMEHEHLFLWLEMLKFAQNHLVPGCAILDFGCSSGELLQLLCHGRTGMFEPIKPRLALGLEQESMRSTLLTATEKVPANSPILFSCASPHAFPEQFDVILSHEVIYLLNDLVETLTSLYLALRPGGIFCAATAGYTENEYYQRWRSRFEARGIAFHNYSTNAYLQAMQRAGFEAIETHTLRLTKETYIQWKHDHIPVDTEWFESPEDEQRYFTTVGKRVFIGKKRRTV